MGKAATFATEADLCAAFLAWVAASAGQYNYGIKTPKLTAYAETAGWDILLVGEDGTQIGVQAKLRFNLKLLDQTIPGSWDSWRAEGPDYRAILVPDADSMAEHLCSALGLTLFRPARHGNYDGEGRHRHSFVPGLNFEHGNGGWHYWSPERRHQLPDYVPDVVAGASGPVQLTKWKIAALRIVARIEINGFVTRDDFRQVGVDPRRWTGPSGWLVPSNEPGRFVRAPALNFDAQHPTVYAQVLEKERDALAPAAKAGLF